MLELDEDEVEEFDELDELDELVELELALELLLDRLDKRLDVAGETPLMLILTS